MSLARSVSAASKKNTAFMTTLPVYIADLKALIKEGSKLLEEFESIRSKPLTTEFLGRPKAINDLNLEASEKESYREGLKSCIGGIQNAQNAVTRFAKKISETKESTPTEIKDAFVNFSESYLNLWKQLSNLKDIKEARGGELAFCKSFSKKLVPFGKKANKFYENIALPDDEGKISAIRYFINIKNKNLQDEEVDKLIKQVQQLMILELPFAPLPPTGSKRGGGGRRRTLRKRRSSRSRSRKAH